MADEKPEGGGAEHGATDSTKDTKNLQGQTDAAKGGAYQGAPPAGAGPKGPLIGFLVVALLVGIVILVAVL